MRTILIETIVLSSIRTFNDTDCDLTYFGGYEIKDFISAKPLSREGTFLQIVQEDKTAFWNNNETLLIDSASVDDKVE